VARAKIFDRPGGRCAKSPAKGRAAEWRLACLTIGVTFRRHVESTACPICRTPGTVHIDERFAVHTYFCGACELSWDVTHEIDSARAGRRRRPGAADERISAPRQSDACPICSAPHPNPLDAATARSSRAAWFHCPACGYIWFVDRQPFGINSR
jgi:rubrerythrin